jgi:hypothetical protein
VFYRRDSACFSEVKETELIEANRFTGSADRSAIIEIYINQKPNASFREILTERCRSGPLLGVVVYPDWTKGVCL